MKTCPQCTAEAPLDDRFCEECGAHLAGPSSAPDLCAKCGAGADAVDDDGFCSSCGFRREAPVRDHFERVLSPRFAGITDRGLRHHRNEDFFLLDSAGTESDAAHYLVVCDGVSSTSEAEKASEAAADAMFRALLQGEPLVDAAMRAQSAVAMLPGEPATTLVAAVVRENHVQIGWMGDSRAYWIAPDGSRQLTRDDSWVNDVVSAGEMSEEDALRSPQAHAITRWLGADALPEDCAASVVELEIPGTGYLLLCSDGLWNYAPDAAALTELIYGNQDEEAGSIVRRLVEFANEKGGQDNITAVLLAL